MDARRTGKHAIAGALAMVATLTLGLGAAQAGIYQFQDSMEPNPSANWWFFDPYPSQSSGSFESGSTAHSPTHDGLMLMSGPAPAWSMLGRNVNISIVYPGAPQRSCVAQVYVQGFSAHGRLEVIDSASWTYITIKNFDINGGYVPVTTSTWIPARGAIHVRVVLMANGVWQAARVDDLVIQCVS